jgi:sugar lactone lactonase YvrE
MWFLLLAACTSSSPDDTSAASGDTAESGGIDVTLAYGDLTAASDSAPSPDGAEVYFAAGDVVMMGPIDGGAAATTLATLDAPVGLVPSADGLTLYVADATGLVALTVATGAAAPLDVGARVPAGVDEATVDGVAAVYFTAPASVDGGAGVYRSRLDSGAVEAVATGAPFVAPSGVVVASDGTVWVTDRAAGAGGTGALIRVTGGAATVVTDGFTAGDPAGVAMPSDESLVLVSALDATGHSEVVIYVVADGSTTTFDDVIGENVGSGGLHRAERPVTDAAKAAGTHDVFSWCGVTSGGSSSVYKVSI